MQYANVTEKTANFVFSRAYDVPVIKINVSKLLISLS